MTRERLLEHLRAIGTEPGVLTAFSAVDRTAFVPMPHRDSAWLDVALPLSDGSTISQPSMVAAVLEELRLAPGMRVLEIGSGSGYLAALMSEMGAEVTGIEIDATLAASSRELLGDGVTILHGDAAAVDFEDDYDRVVVSASVSEPPEWALSLLKKDGFLLAPIGVGVQELMRCDANGDCRGTGKLCRFVPFVTSRA